METIRVKNLRRRKMLVASLMPGAIIGVPLALLLVSQLDSLGRLESATAQLLEQTGIRVAQELAKEARRQLATPHVEFLEALPAVLEARDLDDLADLEGSVDVLDAVPTGPGRFFIGDGSLLEPTALADDASAVGGVLFYGREDPARGIDKLASAFEAADPSGFAYDRTLSRPIAARAAEIAARAIDLGCGFVDAGGERYVLVVRLIHEDGDRRRVRRFAGFAVSVRELAGRFFPDLAARIRRAGGTLSTDEPLEISVLDETGREVYRTGPSLLSHSVHEAEFALMLLGDDHLSQDPDGHHPPVLWTVRAGYPGTSVAALARGTTNEHRRFLVLVTIVAGVGILLSGRAMAREVSLAELKAEFVSSVSHDLKTPLASVQMLADVLRTAVELPRDKVRGYGRVIGEEARKLGNLLDGILEFDRIDAGGRIYPVEELDLRAPVREAVGEYSTQLKEAGFDFQLRLPPRPVAFVGNREALIHAFSNLVGNAIKYSEDRRKVRVTLREVDGNAIVEVRDQGAGIPPTERAKVFDRFYRVRRDAETGPAGTGLGLPIARHIVQFHGGRISVSGAPGGGSIFTVEVPLAFQGGQAVRAERPAHA